MFGITENMIIKLLAYAAVVYILTTVIYLIASRKLGTPFMDAVKQDPELVKIKNESKKKRNKIFLIGLGVSIGAMILLRPFKNYCNDSSVTMIMTPDLIGNTGRNLI